MPSFIKKVTLVASDNKINMFFYKKKLKIYNLNFKTIIRMIFKAIKIIKEILIVKQTHFI